MAVDRKWVTNCIIVTWWVFVTCRIVGTKKLETCIFTHTGHFKTTGPLRLLLVCVTMTINAYIGFTTLR